MISFLDLAVAREMQPVRSRLTLISRVSGELEAHMAVLFVSHSSKDDTAIAALEEWLLGHGFTDVFIDHSNISGGEKWAEALREASGACRVVVCLVTERWLASDECFGEFKAAWYMGKRIIPLLALEPGNTSSGERLAKVLAEDQGLDVAPCMAENGRLDLARAPEVERRLEDGLRAAGALAKVGLDPEAFAIDRKLRPMPFPGLTSFGDDDADAALFYGRSREIAQSLEEIRTVRTKGDLRPFVILGGSGAGKSSLLKAGIIPRLRREAPAWLPLRAFRPGADPLLNFADALARSLADFGKIEAHGVIRDRLFDAWSKAERTNGGLTPAGRAALEVALEADGSRLRAAAGRSAASILISVDQAEEMARAEGDSADALGDYLRVALASTTSSWQLAFTIRTDSFPELQGHRRFQALEARGYDLRAVPVYRFNRVVEEPAKRYGVAVDTAVVDALMEDATREDDLPLLAFALQRLWREYAASGLLTKENYEKVGGLKGLIEDAAERALRGLAPEEDVPLPAAPPPKRQVDLAALTFVPSLAQINDQGTIVRRTAAWNSFNDEQRELLERFDHWRLVVRKAETDGGTVEVAHEALFREWTRLKGWLEPERARLEALRSFQIDALTWARNGRDAAFLNHRGKRLADTAVLAGVESYRKRLGAVEFDYLAACQEAERLERKRTRRVLALVGVLGFGIAAVLIGWQNESYLRERVNWFATMRPYMLSQVRPHVLSAEAERALKPNDSFRECAKDCPEMIVIPAGEFTMGSPETERGHTKPEGPQHSVTIARPFAVSKFDVTFADWDACMSVGGCPEAGDSGWGRGTKPVINVSWDQARQYVAWFAKMTGRPYRLLTEAEWEYVARAGTTTAYSWGDEIGRENANCIACGSAWDNRETSPVGSFKPNAFGLYDMHGNVWQWVEDCYHDDYDGVPTDGSAWISKDCSRRVVRGGSWDQNSRILRSAFRGRNYSYVQNDDLGFRVVRTLTP
jgi:formylglycine-generating enzyme required for sulfatase activity